MAPLPAPDDLDSPEEILLRAVRKGLPQGPSAERDREALLERLANSAKSNGSSARRGRY